MSTACSVPSIEFLFSNYTVSFQIMYFSAQEVLFVCFLILAFISLFTMPRLSFKYLHIVLRVVLESFSIKSIISVISDSVSGDWFFYPCIYHIFLPLCMSNHFFIGCWPLWVIGLILCLKKRYYTDRHLNYRSTWLFWGLFLALCMWI